MSSDSDSSLEDPVPGSEQQQPNRKAAEDSDNDSEDERKAAADKKKTYEMVQRALENTIQMLTQGRSSSRGASGGGGRSDNSNNSAGSKPFVRDWDKYDATKEGPVIFEENEVIPPPPGAAAAGAPTLLDDKTNFKKQKELKKKAEKDAKLQKFLAKKEGGKTPGANAAKDGAEAKEKEKAKAAAKPAKEKGPSSAELLEAISKTPAGQKKPVDGKLPDTYDPKYVEAIWYPWWVSQGYFKPEYGVAKGKAALQQAIEERGKFVMVIPPPNVTGTLHLGHAIMCTLEDVLTRWHRMSGKVTLWVPGCDHAGIATQMVVEKAIARQGLTRHDLGREGFIKRVWQWKEEKGVRIYEQLKRMGISADWDRVAYTMDDKLVKAVNRAFVNLFDWGFIYRSDRLVNWSCTLQSCISDIEVDKVELPGRTLLSVPGYKDKVEFGVLTSFAYKIDDKTEIVVATTRPETMLGDVAIAVHPQDPRYTHLVGKKAKHPFVDRELIIVADEFVDREFGTGCVKITPAHDQNDYDVGKRNNLPFITVIDENGTMKDNCGKFSGMKRFDARKAVLAALTEAGLYRESKDNPMVVPICSRSKDIVEPLLKMQWYINCQQMAKDALEFVESGQLRILPESHLVTWRRWMEGIRDWCISRQLWWGHRIPAYRIVAQGCKLEGEVWVSAETEEEAMQKAKEKVPEAKKIELVRDEDVLDTWFSSGLFPFSVMGWPDETDDLELFYPTDLLETGHDILFFWVAKMIFMASTLTKKVPFKDIFLHSIVRDAHGRKMSKSLGNVIDPLDVISGITLADLYKSLEEGNLDPKEVEKAKQGQKQDYPNGIPECGTDALRFALCACMTQGRDINLDVLRVQGYRFFCNKIWNAFKFSMHYFTMGGFISEEKKLPVTASSIPHNFSRMDCWILGKLSRAIRACNDSLLEYNFQDSTSAIYNFWLYELCDVYLESLKPHFFDATESSKLSPSQKQHLSVLLVCIETGLRLLSSFMPFLTEELWQRLPKFVDEKRAPSICVAPFPRTDLFKAFESETNDKEVAFMNDVIHSIRSTRAAYNLPNKVKTEAFILNSEADLNQVLIKEKVTVCALSFSKDFQLVKTRESVPAGTAAGVISDKCTIFVLLKGLIDFEFERARITKSIETTTDQLKKLQTTMDVDGYEERVPKEVQERDAKKMTTLEGELKNLKENLKSVLALLDEDNSTSSTPSTTSGSSQ